MIKACARVLRLLVVLIACGAAASEGGCRSAAEIDSPDLNVRSPPPLPAEPLPQPGTVRASLPQGAGMDAVRSGCLGCHEPAMLRQQRLTARQWLVEIDKMQGWGAPVSNEFKTQMVGYLVGIAAPDNTRFTPAIVAPLSAEQSSRNAVGHR